MIMKKLLMLLLLLMSCTDIDTTQTELSQANNEGENDFIEKSTPASCNQRWIPTAAMTNNQRDIAYEHPTRNCSHGAQSGAIEFGNYMREHFGSLMNLSIDGEGIQIYNCRSVRGGSSPSVHSEGRAVDVFIPMRNGTANNTNGDVIANWLIDNAKTIGIQYIIWDRTSWKAAGNPSQKCYTGTHPHNDHIHVELTWAASRKQTPFFTGHTISNWANPNPSQNQNNTSIGNQPDISHDSSPIINPDMSINTPVRDAQVDIPQNVQINDMQVIDNSSQNNNQVVNNNSWIGDPCVNNADCAFNADGLIGQCFLAHHPSSNIGFCSIPCDGFCPDAVGQAVTFCIPTQNLGLNLGGICVSKSCAANDYCQRYPGFINTSSSRYIGNSSAHPSSADVCLPTDNPMSSIGSGNGAGNGGVCTISDIPFGDNNESCQGVPAETWRCACSQRLGTVVSQVCRNEVWINFETNPSNCDRCNGIYTNGCNH